MPRTDIYILTMRIFPNSKCVIRNLELKGDLYETDFISEKLFESICSDCQEIIKILVSITKTQNSNSELHIPNYELGGKYGSTKEKRNK